MALGDIGGVGGDFVGDNAVLHVLLVRQAEMFLGRHVAEAPACRLPVRSRTQTGQASRAAIPADHRRPDLIGTGDVVACLPTGR